MKGMRVAQLMKRRREELQIAHKREQEARKKGADILAREAVQACWAYYDGERHDIFAIRDSVSALADMLRKAEKTTFNKSIAVELYVSMRTFFLEAIRPLEKLIENIAAAHAEAILVLSQETEEQRTENARKTEEHRREKEQDAAYKSVLVSLESIFASLNQIFAN